MYSTSVRLFSQWGLIAASALLGFVRRCGFAWQKELSRNRLQEDVEAEEGTADALL
jgi:hypothetical protein